MDIRILQGAVVLTALSLLLLQVTVRQKQIVHLVFAVFCGSMAMMMAKRLGAESLGPYQYLLGLGACATCNGYWLVARALFRQHDSCEQAVAGRHLLIAGSVALLLMSDQGLTLLSDMHHAPESALLPVQSALNALMGLLSSCLLVLAFWEGARGWSTANRSDRAQRLIFLFSYGAAVLSTTVVKAIAPALNNALAHNMLNEIAIALASMLMLVVTQVLIRWRHPVRASSPQSSNAEASEPTAALSTPLTTEPAQAVSETAANEADQSLAEHIHRALREQQRYLQTELKVADLARQFDVSEYRISRAIHNNLGARNFNQLINSLRVEHAKALLADPEKQHWPVLVVGLESGFASVGPFTRAFKAIVGCTPGEYRKTVHSKPLISSTVNA